MSGIRVLVVDDSLLFREILSQELQKYLPAGSALETANDPFEARDKILSFAPDVMLLDVELPRMDGIEFLRRLLLQYPQPTIMLSGTASYRQLALAAGAVDFIVKPPGHILHAGSGFFEDMVRRLVLAAHISCPLPPDTGHAAGASISQRIIAIGASTGGTEALSTVISMLQPPLPGIVVVQHIPPVFSRLFAERLNAETRFKVAEASSGVRLCPGEVYIAPGDRHVRVKKSAGGYQLDCVDGPRVNGHCPSADVLFRSVASAAGAAAVGVILTGMGGDGAKGLLAMRQAGAHTVGQDEASCVVYGMPRVAWELGAVEYQLPLTAIAAKITALAGN